MIESVRNNKKWAVVKYVFSLIIPFARGALSQVLTVRIRPRLIFLFRGAQIKGGQGVTIKRDVRLHEYSIIAAHNGGKIVLGRRFSLGAFSRLKNSHNGVGCVANLQVGDNVGIGEYSFICAVANVTIGDNTIIGQYFSVHPQNHVFDSVDIPIRKQPTIEKGVEIGNDCWVGAKVTILDGVVLGDGCVVGAGSVVTKSFPSRSVIAGSPARIIRKR